MRRLMVITLTLLLVTLATSCGTSQPYGSANQQAYIEPNDDSGIGGTGKVAAGSDSGIGGTGIIGEITGFGSIFVNGVEVEMDLNSQLFLDGKKVQTYSFARGDVVALRAERRGQQYFATEVYILHEVIGPVQQVMRRQNQLRVLGQTIDVGVQALPELGQVVAISGFRDPQGVIHARRIQPAMKTDFMLRGVLKQGTQGWLIGGQRVNLPASGQWYSGQRLQLQGSLQNNTLQVQQFKSVAGAPFKAAVSRLLVQGYVKNTGKAQYRIANQLFSSGIQMRLETNQILHLELLAGKAGWQMSHRINERVMPRGRPLPMQKRQGMQPPLRPMRPGHSVPMSRPYMHGTF